MEWLKVNSVEELKKMGNLKTVRSVIKKDLENYFKNMNSKDKNIVEMIKVSSNNWNGIYDKIKALNSFINYHLEGEAVSDRKNNIVKSQGGNLDYFKSKEEELIFYLLELDGEKRNKKLNITKSCYYNKKDAKKWRNNIAKYLHPDKLSHPKAERATAKLNQLYFEMVGNE